MKKNIGLIVGGTTFALFMGEAIIHYNMGIQKDTPNKKFQLPDKSELVKLSVIVGIFSVLNGVIINYVKKAV